MADSHKKRDRSHRDRSTERERNRARYAKRATDPKYRELLTAKSRRHREADREAYREKYNAWSREYRRRLAQLEIEKRAAKFGVEPDVLRGMMQAANEIHAMCATAGSWKRKQF